VLRQLTLRNDASAVMHEVREHTEFVTGQFNWSSVQRYLRDSRIEYQGATTKFGIGLSAGPANQRSEPRKDFFHPKRLRHVVIGSAIHPLNFFVPASACSQHQNGYENTRFTPSPKDAESIDPGQPKIQHHGIILLGLSEEVGALTIGGAIDRISGVLQRGGNLLAEQRLILDHKNSQPVPPWFPL